MIIAKLILWASPVIVASMLFLANPVAAMSLDSTTGHVNSVSQHSIYELAILNQASKSNPITDHLSCNCAYCVQAKSQLEGKLSISSLL